MINILPASFISLVIRQSLILWALISIDFISIASAQLVIPLYPHDIPNSTGTPNIETGKMDGVYNVSLPTLTIFLPKKEKAGKTGVIICPGGGYGSLVMEREGYAVAREFTEMGVAAFVLKYRLPGNNMKHRATGALQDAQQALKQVRLMAHKYKLNENKIGMIGFSAGGHLVSTAGTHFNQVLIDNKTGVSLRPDFMILVYPVISFRDSLVHKGSMNNLLGPMPSLSEIANFSNELQVTGNTPPTFLVHATDDIHVPPGNSLRFYEALRRNAVPAELHMYSSGGHGFATYPQRSEWMGRCIKWMRLTKLILD